MKNDTNFVVVIATANERVNLTEEQLAEKIKESFEHIYANIATIEQNGSTLYFAMKKQEE